jgi:predicted DCC family thiol-disulfide oxidoreductase YuxK
VNLSKPTDQSAVVLFDGVCNLCNATVNFVIARDPKGYFRFSSLQSATAQELLKRHAVPQDLLDSIVLIESGACYTQSTAALRIARRLKGFWPLLYGLVLVPRPVRDSAYRWVARNRYRWFGTSEACRLMTPELQRRFL